MLQQLAGPSPEQAERLGQIDDAARHLLASINDILDLSEIEAGRLQLEDADFSLAAILDDVRALIAEGARSKGLALTVDFSAVPFDWASKSPGEPRQ